jgi:hypothetical protein
VRGTVNFLAKGNRKVIVSFGLSKESYGTIIAPVNIIYDICVLRDLLSIISLEADDLYMDVWFIKEYGNNNS